MKFNLFNPYLLAASAIISACFILPKPTQAASWLECNGDSGKKLRWSGNSTTARINTISFPPGSLLQSVERGINATNTNPSPFVINTTTETGGLVAAMAKMRFTQIVFHRLGLPRCGTTATGYLVGTMV
ncbi:hypothetical protein [Synechococcus sp. 7002]|uniref:hypothetical protein n=1 Tax=Synechococcus sp. 7002 TaxID=1938862 RepID=UPI000A3AA6EF|nr:hypothetical protein [Synechococcus sp. 7002]